MTPTHPRSDGSCSGLAGASRGTPRERPVPGEPAAGTSPHDGEDELETVLVNDLAAVAGVDLAFRHRVIERLEKRGREPAELGLPIPGAEILLAILHGAGVAEPGGDGRWQLTACMRRLLVRRGPELRARVRFVALAAADLAGAGSALLTDPARFMATSRTFGFFRYDRARETGAAALEDTAPWVDYVSALAEREAPALAPLIPLDGRRRLLEIGGNTGVFALALLALHSRLEATVLDLPAVCRLGAARVRGRPGAERLRFLAGDARTTDWPGADAVLFRSVLHDWRVEDARAMLARAARHLAPGGRVIICERGPVRDEPALGGAAAAANLVFAHHYRDPEVYAAALEALGLRLLPRRALRLDMTFHVVAAERAA